jgi:predicted RNA-binding Zn-ribbon protein involved in translation (DUF1610 family)
MIKTLRVPERLFAVAMWAVSFVFASFLIGLGGRLIADLPGVEETITREQFMSPEAVRASRATRDSLAALQEERTAARQRAELLHRSTESAYQSARQSFDAWIATRVATTDPRQDPEVLRRTAALDSLGAAQREAQREVERIDAQLLEVQQAQEAEQAAEATRLEGVESQYQRALFLQELRVFGLRLLLTLPLLLVAGWLVLRKRKSDYWPLARGFVLFALFAFFVELVPYLPSYGGYVRNVVGIALTLVAARYGIRWMRRYLATRRAEEARTEQERRRALGPETALKRMAAHMCPSCERPIAGAPANPSNFCVHCGLKLFDDCGSCGTHKNAFFPYCPKCGVVTEAAEPAMAPASG